MVLAFYVSGHGFGHASRALEVIAAIAGRRPNVRVVLRTSVARWFLERSSRVPVEIAPAEVDTGMAQIGSLRIDIEETARQAARFYGAFEARVEREAAALRSMGASLVVGDIPPLAFAAAARAGVPSVALGNFTWDWIYALYPEFERLAPGTTDIIRASYAQAALALRLPFHGGFDPMAAVTCDIPLIARRSARAEAEVRRIIGAPRDRPVVLASFGAYGIELSPNEVAARNDFTLVVTDHEVSRDGRPHERVRRIASAEMGSLGLRYEDLVAASDVVVSKPGYGIVSECIANSTALLYTSRDRFAEYDVFVAQMPGFLRCRFLPPEDMRAGRWGAAVADLLAQPVPTPAPPLASNGAAVAADRILQRLPPEEG